MFMAENLELTKRERQIMDVIFKLGKANVAEIMANIPDSPSNSAIRRLVSILVEKGFLKHEWQGPKYVYSPTVDPSSVRETELERITDTFFEGSPVETVAALLDISSQKLSEEDFDRLSEIIEAARREGR